ncbi:MAG TPA: histidine kinase [Opitutus sp.]|nr:histidine kinase [Opitutus sp.]
MHLLAARSFRCSCACLALFVLITTGGFAAETASRSEPDFTLRFRAGDDPLWAAKNFDDSSWPTIGRFELPSRAGTYWVRWHVSDRRARRPESLDGLLLKAVASYDLYWDGHYVGSNGRPADNARDELPGSVDALFRIPDELLGPGEHVIALRMSSFRTGFPNASYGLFFQWANFRELLVGRLRAAMLSVMAIGAGLVVATVFGLMWLLAGRRHPLFLFSLLSLCVALMQALQAWRWLFDYPYHWHYPRMVVIATLVTASAALLPVFVMQHFRVGRPLWVYGIVAIALLAAWLGNTYFNIIGLHASAIGFVTAFVLTCLAAKRRKRGAGFACAGLGVSLLALLLAPTDFLDHAFFISAGPGVLGLLVALVLQLRDERKEAHQARLTAARLEIELLKKNIEPHFLLNTLATLVEIIEQDPKTAVALIEALASEFRLLNRISGEKLIPLSHELELCHAHLQVMSLRKGVRCTLVTEGIHPAAHVPPALFLTLIENGLTHLLPRNGTQQFHLSALPRDNSITYTLLADGVRESKSSAASAPTEGTGLRYIKARLEESFTGAWSLTSRAVPAGWETVIVIPAVDRSPRHSPSSTDATLSPSLADAAK